MILLAALIFAAIIYAISATRRDTPYENTATSAEAEKTGEKYTALNYDSVRAIWLSQFDMWQIYTDGDEQRPPDDYTERVRALIENVKSLGINTVFIQLRPNGDSIYPSSLFPASKYVTGEYGRESEYDAFGIFIDEAHNKGLSVHAWINPLRCMTEEELTSVSDTYQIKKWYNEGSSGRLVEVLGRYYLNPAHREARALICEGVKEIITLYRVDGIHIDDYFYPTTEEFFDATEYAAYLSLGGKLSLADFRREQINELVREIHATVKSENSSLPFGVSPGGNTDRNYNELYADVSLWCSQTGYIDYLCPQIYFGLEHETQPFREVCEKFSSMTETGNVRLIIGLTLEKAYNGYLGEIDRWAGSGQDEWIKSRDILRRCIEHVKNLEGCEGVAFFSYRLFFDPESGEPLEETREEVAAFLPIIKE